jgi:hypothetical protein
MAVARILPCWCWKITPNLASGIRQHGLKHWLKLAGRAADDLQHFGGRCLLLQRFGEFACARLHDVE